MLAAPCSRVVGEVVMPAVLQSAYPASPSSHPEVMPAVLQSAYPLGPRTSQSNPPPAPETAADADTELLDVAPPVLSGSAAREADAYFRRFEWEAGRRVVMEYLRRAKYRGSDVGPCTYSTVKSPLQWRLKVVHRHIS